MSDHPPPTTTPTTTAEDDAYTSFLLKQSKDYSVPKATAAATQARPHHPPPPREALPESVSAMIDNGRFYTSDVDELFEAVSLPLLQQLEESGGGSGSGSSALSSHGLARALGIDEKAVGKLTLQEWDPRGEYRDVVDSVVDWLRRQGSAAAAAEDEVAVFAVQGKGARVEYFVVGLLRGGGEPDGDRIVGTKVLAVES